MPPTPTASKPPKAKGTGKGIGKKVGPFSLWVWLVMGGAVMVVGYLYLRNRSAGDGGGGFVETVTGNQTASPVDQAYGGSGSVGNEALYGQAASTAQYPEPVAAELYYGELRGQIKDIEDALERTGWTFEDQQILPPSTNGFGDASDPLAVVASLGGQQASPTPRTPGVKWGGQTFTTKAGLAAYLSGTQRGAPRAKVYRTWATKHPGAAKQLAGPAPKPRSPVKKQAPPPKAKPKPTPKKPAQKKVKVQAQKKKVHR